MFSNTIQKLEQKTGFDKIRQMVESRCSTEYAKRKSVEFGFNTDFDTIDNLLTLTDEMRVILMLEPSFPDSGYIDTQSFLKQLEIPSTWIDLASIGKLRTSLDTIRQLINFFDEKRSSAYPRLKKMAEPITLFPEVSRRIDSIIDKFGEVRDNASPALQNIRRELKDKEGQISRRINSILKRVQAEGLADEDSSVVIREGKMLIPVNASNKRKIPGYVYDESASGKTVYIEPMEIVELDNDVKELHFAEQREIIKILQEFSEFLRPYLPELIFASEYLCEMDFIRAKAYVAVAMTAGKPIISKEKELNYIRARHPLLESALKKEGKEIVPLNLALNRDKRILLISGPNAGGKSVCLKTTGLLQYMFQCGMLIPASETSELPVFESIFIDIGDEQSIENDLSTYSSHLFNMRNILEGANSKSLILIDEFGAGTEPTAGGAIAEAILSEIEEMGAFGVITTHYSNLKFFASSSRGLINGGMQFDVQNIKPLFKLEIGTPGSSFAFELARKIGLPESVVKKAEERAGSEFVDLERHLKKIAKNRRQWEEKVAKIKSTDKFLENITDRYQKELSEIQTMRKSIISQAKDEAKQLIDEANKKIEATIKEIKESQAEKEKTKIIRTELDNFNKEIHTKDSGEIEEKIANKMEQLKRRQENREKKAIERGQKPSAKKQETLIDHNLPIKAGDKVKIKGSDLLGEVTKVDKKDVSVAVGNIISIISKDKVERISGNQYTNSVRQNRKPSYDSFGISERRLNFKPSIDIRGERLDEAMEIVSRFIDDALMVGMSEVKILHGKGSGVLKEEIRKYLKTIGGVESFRDEHLEMGGSGITVVKLN
jgi:DNA mismatch repair protein MutS2